jgi:hypothetical protein
MRGGRKSTVGLTFFRKMHKSAKVSQTLYNPLLPETGTWYRPASKTPTGDDS